MVPQDSETGVEVATRGSVRDILAAAKQDPRMAQAIARSGFGSPREASRIPNETADEESTEDLAPGSPGRSSSSGFEAPSAPSASIIKLSPSGSIVFGRPSASGSASLALGALTFESYARVHFAPRFKGTSCLDRVEVPVTEVVQFTKVPLTEPLLARILASHTRERAVGMFRHLMSYMGELTTKHSGVHHMQAILGMGIKDVDLRDEIYCHIAKQTTDNPSRMSTVRGWQAMALCLGTFPPSAGLQPYLECHIESVMHGAAAGGAGPRFRGSSTGGATATPITPASAAPYCLARMRKLMRTGARKHVPVLAEIAAVESMEPVKIQLLLPDDTTQELALDATVTAAEAAQEMAAQLGLGTGHNYGVFEVADGLEKLLPGTRFLLDVQAGWAAAAAAAREARQRKRTFSLPFSRHNSRGSTGSSASSSSQEDSLSARSSASSQTSDRSSGARSLPGEDEPGKQAVLMFKRKIFLGEDLEGPGGDAPGTSEGDAVRMEARAFEYTQAVHDVMAGVYPVSEQDAVLLAALQLRADLGDAISLHALEDIPLQAFIPLAYCERHTVAEWRAECLAQIASLPGEGDPEKRRADYIAFLKSRTVLYGSTWFFAEQKANPRFPGELLVTINRDGIFFIHTVTREPLLHVTFTEVCSWGHSTSSFSLVTGNMTYNQDHRLVTQQGEEIGSVIQQYINQIKF